MEVDASAKKGGTDMRPVFADKKGSRRALVDRVFKLAPVFNYHMWVHQMTAHQGACIFTDKRTLNGTEPKHTHTQAS